MDVRRPGQGLGAMNGRDINVWISGFPEILGNYVSSHTSYSGLL